MKKKSSLWSVPFDKKWVWGTVASIVIIPSLTFGWKHLGRVWAGPDEIEQVKSEQEQLRSQQVQQGEWIAQSIKETDMQKKAPKGYRWEPSVSDYVEWKEDPRMKKK